MRMRRLAVFALALGPFLLIAIAYLVAATREIELPGIYMDAVNPDYLVARWLNPDATLIPAWIAPGNDILGSFPLLVGLQHGSLQVWLGAPLFWVFGMSVIGLRLTHAMFALAVLAAWYALLRAGGLSLTLAIAMGLALAVDPTFVYAFRTQNYITMAPAALLMLSVVALLRARTSTGRTRTRWLAACGLMGGMACWGYFVYAFFVPALLLAAWFIPDRPKDRSSQFFHVLVTGTGMALGAALYATGFLLVAWQMGGLNEGIEYYLTSQPNLKTADAGVTMGVRLAHVKSILIMVFNNSWNHALIFSEYSPIPAAVYKFFLLMGVPPLLWLIAEWRRCSTPLLRIVMALQLSFLMSAVIFGPRTNGHHFMALLPLSYAALAAAIGTFTSLPPILRRTVNIAAAAIVVILLTINIVGNVREVEALRRTGGVGMFSDAINRFATGLYEGDHNRLLILPDWGLYMPTALLTQASMEMRSHEDFELARQRLCEGKDVVLALITGNRSERFRQWQTQLDWSAPDIRAYQQRDGKVVFEVATFAGQDSHELCPGTQSETTPTPP
jgi:hypothetical protein